MAGQPQTESVFETFVLEKSSLPGFIETFGKEGAIDVIMSMQRAFLVAYIDHYLKEEGDL